MTHPAEGPWLAFDTAGSSGSLCVAVDGRVLAEAALPSRREHAARLMPAISEVTAEAGVALSALAAIAVGEGPGSFTGVRVAAATAKGLVHALRVPLFAVSSLAGAAMRSGEWPVQCVVFDARGDRVYSACYASRDGDVEELSPPTAGTIGDLLEAGVPADAVIVGEGAERHRALIERAGHTVGGAPAGRPSAPGLVRFLAARPAAEPVPSAAEWEPAYLRPWSGVVG